MESGLREASDAALVVAIARFREEALAEVYRRHGDAAFGLAVRVLRDRALAEELVQEVFLKFWQDPERFWPERFAPEHEAQRPRFAYMPFAAGPRHCIGETFALYEMLMHLYMVGRRYRLVYVPDKPLELEAQINLRTRHPLHMRLERR